SCCIGWRAHWRTRFPGTQADIFQLPITRWRRHPRKQAGPSVDTETWFDDTFSTGDVCSSTANRGGRRPDSRGPLRAQRPTQAAHLQGNLPGMSDAAMPVLPDMDEMDCIALYIPCTPPVSIP
uniref:Uncharacterized protein n=1 Tax=Aegilops tauschii subsp. strangulata TaxID=200361 RepID=A0A453B160_AEGTS